MKKFTLLTTFSLVILLLLLLIVGCNQTTGPDFSGAEFTGIWALSDAYGTETLFITTTTFTVEDTGSIVGKMKCSITYYDENTNHIKMTTDSVTGIFTLMASVGTVWYVTYNVSGNELHFDTSDAAYPVSAFYFGPYIKQ